MEFSIKLHTIKSGWSIVTGYYFQKILYIVFFSLKFDFVLSNSADPDEMPHYMRHFIWVFTVCQNNPLGVSDLQRVNRKTLKFNQFTYTLDTTCMLDIQTVAGPFLEIFCSKGPS